MRSSLSSPDLQEIMLERALESDQTTIYRGAQRDAPDLEKRSRPPLKATTASWKVDETHSTIKKVWFSLSRAVDAEGNTRAFLLSPRRDAEAARRFFSS